MRNLLTPVLFLLPLVACGSSPTKPSASDPPGGSSVLLGQTVSAIDDGATPNLSVRIADGQWTTSDGSGFFQAEVGPSGSYHVVVHGSSVVDRDTRVAGPAAERVRVSLIPASFDLVAFDEMARTSNARLQRWTSRPALVILASVMQYRTGSAETYQATTEVLTDADVSQLVAHLTEGLALLTGNIHTSFESVSIERPAAGTEVSVLRTGSIVVGRYIGISNSAHTIGYGQWAAMSDGTIAGGATFLDRDFDRDDPRRRLLRIHELGHALGYQHVQATPSIMRPSIGPEPTEFDRQAARIAYRRPIGNRAPDVDPPANNFAIVTGEVRWSPPTICR